MKKCWNCGQPTNDETSRVCSDEICQRAEKKSSNGEFIVRTTSVIKRRRDKPAKDEAKVRASAFPRWAAAKDEAKARAKARTKAAAKARAKVRASPSEKLSYAKGLESRERMKKTMQDLGMTEELNLYFEE